MIKLNFRYTALMNDKTNTVTFHETPPLGNHSDCRVYEFVPGGGDGSWMVSTGYVETVFRNTKDVTAEQAVILFHNMISLMETAGE